MIKEETIKSFTKELETFASPLIVFCIGYLHHIYFSHDIISPCFVVSSLLSVILVFAYQIQGLYAAGIIQAFFICYVGVTEPSLFLEQSVFSASVLAALTATHLAQEPAEAIAPSEPKERFRDELFNARREITSLYQERERLQLELEAATLEKRELQENIQSAEADIAKLIADMREMAERKPAKRVPKEALEAKYTQLRLQFEEKAKTLDLTRRDLFHVQEEVEVLKRTLELEIGPPTETEKALISQLSHTTDHLTSLEKSHQEELVGYEEVIKGLLQQLNSTTK